VSETLLDRLIPAKAHLGRLEEELYDAVMTALGEDPENPEGSRGWFLIDGVHWDDYDASVMLEKFRGDREELKTPKFAQAMRALGFRRLFLDDVPPLEFMLTLEDP
jgi:hypothetical protein